MHAADYHFRVLKEYSHTFIINVGMCKSLVGNALVHLQIWSELLELWTVSVCFDCHSLPVWEGPSVAMWQCDKSYGKLPFCGSCVFRFVVTPRQILYEPSHTHRKLAQFVIVVYFTPGRFMIVVHILHWLEMIMRIHSYSGSSPIHKHYKLLLFYN